MKNLFQIIILLLIIGCQNNNNELISLEENNYQRFEVSCDRDTILKSREGVKIIIKANTFICSKNKKIELKFASIIDKSDMILNRIYSINENGQFLESGGMFQIEDLTNNSESFNQSIKLEIPTSIGNPQMSKYSSKDIKGLLVWSKTENNIELINDENLETGKKLFTQNCTSCHSLNLRNELTGPALGNIHLFRDKEWLIRFTKNSYQMISEGDSISVCLFQEWNASVMSSYPMLSNKEIESIYEFIANESRLQGIGKNEIDYIVECEPLERGDFNNNISITPNFDNATIFEFNSDYQYLVELSESKWINVDYLAFVDSKIDPIILNLDKEYENTTFALAFQERNIVIPFEKDKVNNKKYSLWHPREKDKIDFPLGEKVNIVAYSHSGDFKYRIMEYQPKKENNTIEFSLELKDKKEFLNEIEKL